MYILFLLRVCESKLFSSSLHTKFKKKNPENKVINRDQKQKKRIFCVTILVSA